MTVDDLKKKLEEFPGDSPLAFSLVEYQSYFFIMEGDKRVHAYTDIPIGSVQFTKLPGSNEVQVDLFRDVLREPTTLRCKDI